MNNVPLIGWERLVDIDIRQKAKGKYNNPEINPTEEKHEDHEGCNHFRLFNVGLEVDSTGCHKNITDIMDNQNHNAGCDLIAHHGEKDKAGSHEMMKHPFVIFSIVLFNNYQFKN